MQPPNVSLKCLPSHHLLLLFLCAATLCCAQENPLPSLETQVAPGIEALKSGDLDTAERIFANALQHGAKHPLVYHNLGVIAQMRNLDRKSTRLNSSHVAISYAV